MPIEIVKTEKEFLALREQWNDLLSRSPVDTVFLTWDWLWSWWESYAKPADDLHIILIRNSAGTITGPVNGVFTVTGSHTYTEDGEVEIDLVDVFPVKVTITCPGFPSTCSRTMGLTAYHGSASAKMSSSPPLMYSRMLRFSSIFK